jgi:ribosome recycling factor
MDSQTILKQCQEAMGKAVEHFAADLRGVRSGRATPALVEHIKVEYYGVPTPLGQMAQISCPEPRQIAIKPFDVSQAKEVAKAIQASDLGVTPQVDGKLVRLSLPPLSEERRKKLVALVKEKAEAAKVSIRNVRRDANKHAETGNKDGDLTDDDLSGAKEEIQNATKAHEDKVEDLLKKKVEELMSV